MWNGPEPVHAGLADHGTECVPNTWPTHTVSPSVGSALVRSAARCAFERASRNTMPGFALTMSARAAIAGISKPIRAASDTKTRVRFGMGGLRARSAERSGGYLR